MDCKYCGKENVDPDCGMCHPCWCENTAEGKAWWAEHWKIMGWNEVMIRNEEEGEV